MCPRRAWLTNYFLLLFALLQLAFLSSLTSVRATLFPARVRSEIYLPSVNVNAAGIRLYTPWLIVSTAVRILFYFNQGERAIYDANLAAMAAAFWHWSSECWIHGTISPQFFLVTIPFDVLGISWLVLARDAVTGG